jgi:hypothetical protein
MDPDEFTAAGTTEPAGGGTAALSPALQQAHLLLERIRRATAGLAAAHRNSALVLEQMGTRHPDWDGAGSDQTGYSADSPDYPGPGYDIEEPIDWGFQAPVAQPEPNQKPSQVEL